MSVFAPTQRRYKYNSPPTVMQARDAGRRVRLLQAWDYVCVICGHDFDDISSVSIEHLVPASMGGGKGENLAPTHYNCNKFRGQMSLLEAVQRIARKRRVMGLGQFRKWINVAVPHRIIPPDVWVPSWKPEAK